MCVCGVIGEGGGARNCTAASADWPHTHIHAHMNNRVRAAAEALDSSLSECDSQLQVRPVSF